MKQLNKLALALAATLVAGSVMAEGPQLYVAGGAGQAEFDQVCDGLNNCDDKDTSWKIAGGAKFNQYIAVEFQYQDIGEATYKVNGASAGFQGESVGIHVLPQLPLTEELSIYARLGFIRAGVEGTGAAGGSTWETTNAYGFGLQWDINEQFAVRGEYEFIDKIGEDDDNDINGVDVNYIGVSGVYKF